ncbi:MAG TPA: sensor histidine kinase [Steroidobacteraceae bacterium]|nr:sensor histidine kinase [Steroidobacteraceae bacterium]
MTTASKTAQTDTAAVPHRKSRAGLRPKPLASIGALDGLGPQSAIEKAKLDWESTADALAALVCLLGHKGQVMRTNRVVEDWALGTVAGVIGKTAHALLHPGCRIPRCTLNAFFSNAMGEIRHGTRQQFELQEQIGARFLHFTIRPMRLRPGTEADRGDPRAVLVVSDLSALYRAQDALERLNSSLESRVRVRTQALADANRDLQNEIIRREQAEVALRASRNELMALSEQLIGAQEGERKRIAVELHDSVGQSLSAVKYTLERGLELLRQPRRGDSAAVFELAVRRIQETAEGIRAISMNLRPKILDDLGAASALQWFCRDFAEIYPSIAIVTELSVGDREVPDRLSTVVYRCVQELLNNVAKHAEARHVLVKLWLEEGVLMLQVRDNGVGLDHATAESRRHGSGLRNLRERAQMTGGVFSITMAPGRGTLAQLSWRLEEGEQAKA